MNQEDVIIRDRELQPSKLTKKNQERKRRKGRKSVSRVLTNLALTYLQKSSIHGLRNLVNPNHNFFQRLFSASVVIFCFIVACKNIVSSYHTYQQASQVTSLKSDKIDISNAPFPGVAVCNINPIKKSALVRMANRLKDEANLSFNDTYNALIDLNQVHIMGFVPRKQRELLNYILVKNGQSHNLTGLITELSHRCDDMLRACFYNQIQIPCKNLFMEAVVPGGHTCCLSKNSVLASDSFEAPIWKTSKSGESTGISFNLELDIEEYLLPAERGLPTQAAEVMIYDPRSHPFRLGVGVTSILAGYKDITLISINPSIENNANWVGKNGSTCKRTIESFKRQSKTFVYSLPECIFRCIIRTLHTPCQCYAYMHKFDFSYQECSIDGLECIWKQASLPNNTGKDFTKLNDILEDCSNSCPPACETIQYQSKSSTLIQDQFSSNVNETHVRIYFENQFVDFFEREPTYTAQQLVVQIIGQCSLFLGGSIASIVEVIYFITLRLLCELYTNRKPQKNSERRRLDMEEICEGTSEGRIYWNEILADID